MTNMIRKSTAQQIVDTVHDVCNYDVNFIDPKGIIFASTNSDRIGDYHEIGRRAAETGKAFEVTGADDYDGTQMGINLPFSYNGEIVGVIGISGDPDEVRKYGYLAQRITRLILREQEQNAITNNKKSMLHACIHALTQGEPIRGVYYQNFLETFRVDVNEGYRCVLVQIDERFSPANFSLLENTIYQTFEKMESRLYTFDYPRNFILLLPDRQWSRKRDLLRKLAADYAEILKIGVGFSVGLLEMNKSFSAAVTALRSFRGDGALVCFDELTLEILTESISDEARRQFLAKTTTGLSDTDLSLLKTYFSSSCSLKETSERLYLHKNTIQYRLDRIASGTGFNPREFQDAVVLYLGVLLSDK